MGTFTQLPEVTAAVTPPKIYAVGGRPLIFLIGTFVFTTSYAAGGEALSHKLISEIVQVYITVRAVAATNASHYYRYNPTTGKIQAFVQTTGVEAADAQDLSAQTLDVMIVGYGP